MKFDNIQLGQIWVTTGKMKYDSRESVTCESCGHSELKTVKAELPEGTIFEICYSYEWHCRTSTGKYFRSDPACIRKDAEFLGTISSHFRNKGRSDYTIEDALIKGLDTPAQTPESEE